jgi:hypothetical protein
MSMGARAMKRTWHLLPPWRFALSKQCYPQHSLYYYSKEVEDLSFSILVIVVSTHSQQ